MFTDETNLSTELEWMLQSTQASDAMIVDAVGREYSQLIYRLALSILNDPQAAREALQDTLIAVPANRHRYTGELGIWIWLYRLTVGVCRRYRRDQLTRWAGETIQAGRDWFSRSQLDTGGEYSVTEVDRQLWSAVDQLGENLRISILLRYIHGLNTAEVAQIVYYKEDVTQASLRYARHKLHRRLRPRLCQLRVHQGNSSRGLIGLGHRRFRQLLLSKFDQVDATSQTGIDLNEHLRSCPPCYAYAVELAELDHLLERSLPARWSEAGQAIIEPEDLLPRVNDRMGNLKLKLRKITAVQQFAASALAIVFFFAIAWITNRAFPQSAAPPVQHTVQVTQIVQVPVTLVVPPTPEDSGPVPLTDQSTPEEIRHLMTAGNSLWKRLWLDAQIIRYGPSGYIGPPLVFRNQIWIDQPDQKMVLSGTPKTNPEYVMFNLYESVYEMDLQTGVTYYYQAGQYQNSRGQEARPAFLGTYGYDTLGLRDGSFVLSLVYPGNVVQSAQNLHQHGSELVLGRPALVVDMRSEDGTRQRVWVDMETGISLRWLKFDQDDPRTVSEEIILTGLVFETPFPEESYSYYFFSPDRFRWENEWRPELDEAQQSQPNWSPPLGRDRWLEPIRGARTYRLVEPTLPAGSDYRFLAPPGFDLSDSRLIFQWQPALQPGAPPDSVTPGTSADVFADGRYLGQVEMGNPWNLFCERSPDGSLIAFVDPPAGPDGLYITRQAPKWFQLTQPEEVHNSLPNSIVASSDFAFSPDSQNLAFWGCGGSEDNCGIYLQNTQTGKNKKLLALDQGATFFTWSPDGEYLAFYTSESKLLVVRSGNGEVVYTSDPFGFQSEAVPEDSPTINWGTSFPPVRTGLEGCTVPEIGR